ncbi:MAG: hypothetical protein ACK504_11860 [Bacteroidota bacterium]
MEHNKQEEIDLGIILGIFKNIIKSIFKNINSIIVYSFQNKFKLSVFIISGGVLGYLIFYNTKPYYKSTLLISNERFDNAYCEEMIKTLGLLIENSNSEEEIARKFNIGSKYIDQIKSIEYKPITQKNEKIYEDSAHVVIPFKLDLEVFDLTALDSLEKGILHYLESNEYVSKLKSIDSEILNQKIHRLNIELESLDSLKEIVAESIITRTTGNGINIEAIDPSTLYEVSEYLFDEKISVQKEQKLNNSFNVLVGFYHNTEPEGFGKGVFILIGCIIGFIFSIIIYYKKK